MTECNPAFRQPTVSQQGEKVATEASLYRRVETFAEKTFGCRFVKQQVGTHLGKIDVAGVQELRGDLESDSEIVAIEVKEEGAAFLNAMGQATAYSVYAHRCYLAVRKRYRNRFSPEEMQVAGQFGVGLIEIGTNAMSVRLTSRRFAPENRYVLQIIHKLGLFRCSLCRAVYEDKEATEINPRSPINLAVSPKYFGQLAKVITRRRNAKYYLYELHSQREDPRSYVWDRRYLCKDCISIFASLVPGPAHNAG